MKKLTLLLILFTLLAACAAPATDTPAASPGPSAEATRTRRPSQTPGPTKTLIPSHTPKPSNTITPIPPLPTIPTFATTFDVRTIVTATPAPKAECPKVISATNPDIGFLDISPDNSENSRDVEKNILNFLNQYGAKSLYNLIKPMKEYKDAIFQDLTNDDEPEIAFGAITFYVFGCKNGQYVKLFELEPDAYLSSPRITDLKDGNRDGVPELTVLLGYMTQGAHSFGVFEWNGEKFTSLLAPDYPAIDVEAAGEIHYEDINQDFVQELIVNSGIPIWEIYDSGLPWRNEKTYYFWNGNYYLPGQREFTRPEFRFQAVQDGDLAVNQQEYTKALDLYQQVIFNNDLRNYSPEIRKNLQQVWRNGIEKLTSPTPVPPDPAEHPRLAAYAYYRMVILHTFLGEAEAAQVKYATLQEKFPAGNPGHPYVEMATNFWNTYQSSGLMYDACAAAIAYADAHPEILTPLGSDYHGWQSHTYIPADVCPFR